MEPAYSAMVEKLEEIYRDWGVDIVSPPEGPMSGAIRQVGGSGLIRYRFAENERGGYLEYYSFHRIGGDAHARIYGSGEVERLATVESMMLLTGDPEKDDQQREAQNERNRKLLEELEAAGLLSGGPVPGSFAINSALATGAVDPDEPPSE